MSRLENWTKSTSGDLDNQKIQFYSDGTCMVTSGSLIDLASAALEAYEFTAPADGTYTYKVTSIDTAENETVSACSALIETDTSAPNAAVPTPVWPESRRQSGHHL